MGLDATIAVNSQTMAVYPDRMTVDQHVSLDQRKMNVKRFRISSERGRKISVRYIRQTDPPIPQSIEYGELFKPNVELRVSP